MNIKINAPTIHNRFDIYKNGKQVAFAENIILDQMWTRLCSGSSYFGNIHYGTGTGTLGKTRTSLFTHLGTKTVTNVAKVKAFPTSYWRQSIELGLTDAVGSTLTEVGIAYDATSNYLVTHAMIRDMNGNPISILKTNIDILTIYATVYFTLDNSHSTIKMFHPETNQLIASLFGETSLQASVQAGFCGESNDLPVSLIGKDGLFATTSGSWSADVANKRRILSTPRFNVNDANGPIKEFSFANIARIQVPASGIYAGLDIVGSAVGNGDGINSKFILPSANINTNSIIAKVDGISVGVTNSSCRHNIMPRYNGVYPSLYVGNYEYSKSCSISADGTRAVMLTASGGYASRIMIIDKVDGIWKRTSASLCPIADNTKCAISGDGNVVAAAGGQYATKLILVYELISGSWTPRPDPPAMPSYDMSKIVLNADGRVLAVSHAGSPYVTVYDWSGIAWIKRPSVSGIASYSYLGTGVSITPNGNTILVGHASGVFIYCFDWNGLAWTKRSNPVTPPTDTCIFSAISDDGLVAIVGNQYGTGLFRYHWENSAWIQKATLTVGANIRDIAISGDGTLLFVVSQSSPYRSIYEWIDNAWVAKGPISPAPLSTTATGCGLSKDGNFGILSSYDQDNHFVAFNTSKIFTEVTFSTPPGLITAEAVGTGDGSDVLWPLLHTPIGGSLVVKLDGVTTTDYTLSGTDITFNTAPGVGVLITADYRYTCTITADYTVDGIHKTTTRVIDLTFTIQFGEPV